jgi:hypothetical protein
MKKSFQNLLGNAIAGMPHYEILVREELRSLIPPLTQDELNQLEANILSEGLRDPLVVWPTGGSLVLIDGHNRHSICQKHSIPYTVRELAFQGEEDVRTWMIHNQLGRRNLSPEQQSYLRGLRYNAERAQGRRSDLTSAQNEQKSTAEKLAREFDVSPATIRRDGDFAKAIDNIGQNDPVLKNEILSGRSELSKTEVAVLGSASQKEIPKPQDGKKQSLTVKELASLCLSYAKYENRSFSEVCSELGFPEDVDGVRFFIQWQASREGAME